MIGTKYLDLGSAMCGTSERRFQRQFRNVSSSMSFTRRPEFEKLLVAIFLTEEKKECVSSVSSQKE